MIVNTELRDALDENGQPTRQLVLSYVNSTGTISFLTYNIPLNQMFQWKYAKRGDTVDRNFMSWDFKPVVKVPIKGGYIGPQRIHEILLDLIAANPQAVEDYKGGKVKALQALFGSCMKELKGAAEPAVIKQILEDKLK